MVILLHHMQVSQVLLQLQVELSQVVHDHQVADWAVTEVVQGQGQELLQYGGGEEGAL